MSVNPPEPAAQEPKTIQMTQDKLDEIIQDRVNRAVSKFGDYDTIKTQLADLQRTQESEAQRLVREAREQVEAQIPEKVQAATASAKQAVVTAELRSQAVAAGFKYPEDVISLLAGHKDLEVKDDYSVKGAEKLVKDLAEKRPEWLAANQFNGAPYRNGLTPPGGNQPETEETLAARLRHRRQVIGINGNVF